MIALLSVGKGNKEEVTPVFEGSKKQAHSFDFERLWTMTFYETRAEDRKKSHTPIAVFVRISRDPFLRP